MTLASKSENFYFSPNSILNFRKSYQIWGNKLRNKNVTGKKQISGWGGGGVIGLKLRLDSALDVFKALEVSRSARAGTEWSQLCQWTTEIND